MKTLKNFVRLVLMIALLAAATSIAAKKTEPQFEQKRQAEAEAKRQAAEAAKTRKEEQKQLEKQLAEARQRARAEIEQAKHDRDEELANLDTSAPAEQLDRQKKQIEADFRETLAKIDMKLRLTTAKQQLEQATLPEDTTVRLKVKEIRFKGNTLISTAELLASMPVVFNTSSETFAKADSKYLYDFTPLFEIILEPGEAREVSARTIQGLTQYVLSVYQQKNYGGIYVYVPAGALKGGTELKDGILQVDILEATVIDVGTIFYDVNQAEVEKGYLDPNAVLAWSPVKPGDVVNKKKLDDYINLLNLNPDRYVSATVKKGTEPNTLAIDYGIYEASPWHWFIQVDNSGARKRQWNPRIGVINTNLLGFDDSFFAIYQAPPESDWEDNYSLFGSYDFPLAGPGLRLNIYGGYSEFDLSPEASDIDFFGGGRFIGADLRYNIIQVNDWFFDVIGSISEERSRIIPSEFEFPELFASNVRMTLWGIAVDIHKRDDVSNTSIGYKRTSSMSASDQNEFSTARSSSDPYFTFHTFSAAHSRKLDPNKISRLSTTFKWVVTEDRLVPAKMMPLGGMYTVRGYDEYETIGDGGVLASAQYEFDLVRYEKVKGRSRTQIEQEEKNRDTKFGLKKLAPLAFADFGRSRINQPAGSEKGHETLFSIGIGTIVEIGDNFSGGVYAGYPLKETEDTRRGKGRVNVSLMMRW